MGWPKGENHWNWGKHLSEDTKRKISEAQKGEKSRLWNKPLSEKHKRKISETLKGRPKSDETRRKLSEALKGRRHSDESKHKMSEAKKGENHPNWGKRLSEDTRRKLSEAKIGEKNPYWRGGTSSESYNPNWRQTRKIILKRDSYRCQMPDCNKPGTDVHHIDYCKKNDEHSNLLTLCHSCHSKTGFNRDQWIPVFEGGITV